MDTKVADFAEKLGKRIVQLRKENNFAQERLATLARMNKGYLSSVESGQRVPSVGMLAKLSKVLQVQLFDMFVFPDSGPLDRLWEEIRKGGSPAAEQLRNHYGLGTPAQAPKSGPRTGQRTGRSVKTLASGSKKAAKTHVKASSRSSGTRAAKPATAGRRPAARETPGKDARRKSR